MGIIKILNLLVTAAGFIIPLAILLEAEGLPGEEKHAAVLAKLKAQLEGLNLKFPVWIERFVDPLLGLLIDSVVFYLNKMGFFTKSGDSQSD